MTPAQIAILADELSNDPIARGYSGMTDQEAADDLNTVYRDDPSPPQTINGAQIWNAIDATEYDALSADDKALVDFFFPGGDLPIQSGLIKTKLFGIFGGGTTTRANLIALAQPQITRAQELGILNGSEEVGPAHVALARA